MKVFTICFMIYLFLIAGISQAFAEEPEVLLGIRTDFDKKEFTIEVVSTGCTRKEDFRFDYKGNVLTVIRKVRDACKAMPGKIGITYTLKEIGIDPHTTFRISNKFIVNENIAIIR